MSDAKWSRLENAAKIFPSTTSREDTKVFRFTCELTEMVQEAPLQAALEETLEFFPFYRYSLRRGVFCFRFFYTFLAAGEEGCVGLRGGRVL